MTEKSSKEPIRVSVRLLEPETPPEPQIVAVKTRKLETPTYTISVKVRKVETPTYALRVQVWRDTEG